MYEGKLVDELTTTEELTVRAVNYRECMAGLLRQSLALMAEVFEPVDLTVHMESTIGQRPDDDPVLPIRLLSQLLVKKARLHVYAAWCANDSDNLHSLGVQMRPALECAGQVVSVTQQLFSKKPSVHGKLVQYLDADYFHTLRRITKGQLDTASLKAAIANAHPIGETPPRKAGKLGASDTVKSLEFGPRWYAHLSDSFHYPDLDALQGFSFCGGVTKRQPHEYESAYAFLLDYLAHQVLVMIMYAGLLSESASSPDGLCESAAALLNWKREKSAQFKESLTSSVQDPETPLNA